MENMNNLCGCSQQKLASRSTEENLNECRQCGILISCPYPQTAMLKMAKDATEESESPLNLKEIAMQSHDFAEFHQTMNALVDKHQPSTNHDFSFHEHAEKQEPQFRRPNKNVNLQALARESLYFGEFHAKTQTQDE
jgi:DNA helicase IV